MTLRVTGDEQLREILVTHGPCAFGNLFEQRPKDFRNLFRARSRLFQDCAPEDRIRLARPGQDRVKRFLQMVWQRHERDYIWKIADLRVGQEPAQSLGHPAQF